MSRKLLSALRIPDVEIITNSILIITDVKIHQDIAFWQSQMIRKLQIYSILSILDIEIIKNIKCLRIPDVEINQDKAFWESQMSRKFKFKVNWESQILK